jgi:hypothetical protein
MAIESRFYTSIPGAAICRIVFVDFGLDNCGAFYKSLAFPA